MTHQEYSLKTDLKLLEKYKARELNNVPADLSAYQTRSAIISINNKYAIIKESLVTLNEWDIRPSYSLLKIIEEYSEIIK